MIRTAAVLLFLGFRMRAEGKGAAGEAPPT